MWSDDIAECVERINKDVFTLEDIYVFEDELSVKYPNNGHIKEKIRQQLQVLRDNGYIVFLERGRYKKLR